MTSTGSGAPAASSASYSTDPALYIYTSLTAGSSHIVTATSRLETILRANRVPFKAIDIATDEKARMLWGRRAGKDESGRVRKLPGLVQMGIVLGDLVEIEEWNEYGELKQHVTMYYDEFTQPPISQAPKAPPPAKPQAAVIAAKAAAATAHAAAPSAPTPPPAPAPKTAHPPAAAAGSSSTSSQAKSTVGAAAAKVTLPIRSVAEEAAEKAKQLRLQALREKVYGKGGSKEGQGPTSSSSEQQPKKAPEPVSAKLEEGESSEEDGEEEDDKAKPTPAGLQSPTSGGWKDPAALPHTLQSPTTSSWKPTDVEPPVTSYLGSVVASASAEEIAAIERAETIKEVSSEEEEDSEKEAKKDKK